MDSDREKFRVYVEKSGVMSSLTDALVKLYELPQKPDDALGYINSVLSQNNVDRLRQEMLEEKIQELEAENKKLREQLNKCQQEESMLDAQQ